MGPVSRDAHLTGSGLAGDSLSQPELGANPVSLRPPNWPKGGPMGFLDIPGLNIAQKSGEKGWNPANGVPFCTRAYICRRSPLSEAKE